MELAFAGVHSDEVCRMRLDDVVKKYDAAAKHYDRLMDFVFGKLLDLERKRARLVELLGNVRGRTVLDVGCGTGRNFPLLVAAVGREGRVIGLDCSPGMLDQARARVARNGWSNVDLVLDDAVTLASVREPVDAIVSAWCYGTVYDLGAALDRAVDVLRPGGAIAIMTFVRAAPEGGPLRWLYPLCRFAVQSAGLDPGGDFDDDALEAKWRRGRQVLDERIGELTTERYLRGAGLILAGRKPYAHGAEPKRAGVRPSVAPLDEVGTSSAPLEEGPAMP